MTTPSTGSSKPHRSTSTSSTSTYTSTPSPRSTISMSAVAVLSVVLVSVLLLSPPCSAMPYGGRGICNDPRRVLDPSAQRICNFVVAFKNIGEFTDAMEDLLDAKVVRNTMTLNDPEVKRQDLDHVFLRFGRSQQPGEK